MAVFNVPQIIVSEFEPLPAEEKHLSSNPSNNPSIITGPDDESITDEGKLLGSKEQNDGNIGSTATSLQVSTSFRRVSDVLILAKKWKTKTQENQTRRESLLIKEDVDMVPEAEQQQQKSLKCLPKTAINALTEEALSIVIKTERKYSHHLGSKHPLATKAMKKANDLCVELGKEPIYTLNE